MSAQYPNLVNDVMNIVALYIDRFCVCYGDDNGFYYCVGWFISLVKQKLVMIES